MLQQLGVLLQGIYARLRLSSCVDSSWLWLLEKSGPQGAHTSPVDEVATAFVPPLWGGGACGSMKTRALLPGCCHLEQEAWGKHKPTCRVSQLCLCQASRLEKTFKIMESNCNPPPSVLLLEGGYSCIPCVLHQLCHPQIDSLLTFGDLICQ